VQLLSKIFNKIVAFNYRINLIVDFTDLTDIKSTDFENLTDIENLINLNIKY